MAEHADERNAQGAHPFKRHARLVASVKHPHDRGGRGGDERRPGEGMGDSAVDLEITGAMRFSPASESATAMTVWVMLSTGKTILSLHLMATETGARVEKEVRKLREQLEYHEHRYYVLDDPEIGDAAYDALMNRLKALEA